MFNDRSQSRIQGVDPRLVEVLIEARRRTGIPFEVSEGMRAADRQRELVEAGKSQTMNSRHLHGNAIDIHILNPDGTVNWDFEAYRPIADAAKAIAAERGYSDLVWGGDWKSLKDGVHFQIGGRYAGSPGSAPTDGQYAPREYSAGTPDNNALAALLAAPGSTQDVNSLAETPEPRRNALAVDSEPFMTRRRAIAPTLNILDFMG